MLHRNGVSPLVLEPEALAFSDVVGVSRDQVATTRRCRDVVPAVKTFSDEVVFDLGRRGRFITEDGHAAANVVVHKNAGAGIGIALEIATDQAVGSKTAKSGSGWEQAAEGRRIPSAILNLDVMANYCRTVAVGVDRYIGAVISLKVATNCPITFKLETSVLADRHVAAHHSTASEVACRVVGHDEVAFNHRENIACIVTVRILGQSKCRGCQQRTERQRGCDKAFHIFLLRKIFAVHFIAIYKSVTA